jgi:hypothetical protein
MTLEPCRAGFDGCDAWRAGESAKHPRTPRVRECQHLPIPPERPEKLQGPEIGARVIFRLYAGGKSRTDPDGLATVIERSYVWAPGDRAYHGGSRRYDWKVVRFDSGRTLCVDDKDLVPA